VRKLGRLAVPVLAYVLIHQIGLWVVNILAAQVQGGISAYQYGYIFFQLPYGIVAVSIITALFPTLSEQFVRKETGRMVESTSLGVRTTAFVILPASVVFAVLSEPIVRLLLERLNFGTRDTEMLSAVVFCFTIGLFFFSLFMLILKVFYSMQDTKTPMVVAAILVAFNIGVDFLYFYSFDSEVMKVAGLALGNTTAHFIGAVIVWVLLWRRLGSLDGRRVAVSLSKICLASGITGVACWGTAQLVESWVGVSGFWGQLLQVTMSILVACVVYLGTTVILKSEEMRALRRLLSRFLKRSADDLEPRGREPVDEDSTME